MSRRHSITAVVIAMAVMAALTAARPAEAQLDQRVNSVTWQSAGDSYSSGEGVAGNEGACAQSDEAYGPLAATFFADSHGGTIANHTFTACSGHLVEDYFNPRDPGRTLWAFEREQKQSLWGWGLEQGGPDRLDVITMSFGGNDIGFADILIDCLPIPDSFTGFLSGGLANGLTGCDPAEADLASRIDQLLDPTAPDGACTGHRADGSDGFDCPLLLSERRGSIIDFYYDVVNTRLTPRGRLIVVGYPLLFAPPEEWIGWRKVSCYGIGRGDTEKIRRVSEHLNGKLREAVDRANQALGQERVLYVDRAASFSAGGHDLCGPGDDWLNGIAVRRGGTSLRHMSSFHPNAAGHRDTAIGVAQIVAEKLPDVIRPTVGPGEHAVEFTHPTWGPSTLVTHAPDNPPGPAWMIVYGPDGQQRWRYDNEFMYDFAPAGVGGGLGPTDALGHLFIDFNPGRYNGVIVLRPAKDGFDHFDTLPDPDDYAVRTYGGVITDEDGDAIFEVTVSGMENACYPDNCASDDVYRWDGTTYNEVRVEGMFEGYDRNDCAPVPVGAPDKFRRVTACLWLAWADGDRAAAGEFAEPWAVDRLFDHDWSWDWHYGGCYGNHSGSVAWTCYLVRSVGDRQDSLTLETILYDDVVVVESVEASSYDV